MTESAAILHVTPSSHDRWVVVEDEATQPLSEHGDASAALRAAAEHAEARGGAQVLVHDRYHHVHRDRGTRPGRAS